MDPIIVTSAATALATTVATKSLESPLKTVNDLWDGTIGHTIAAWSEKRKLIAYQNIESFKQDLADEVNKIPIENIQEPQISIVGPTLEASKYYMDEEELRLMFAKIISASMDSRKNGYVQHSFVEIIKQLTPLDAQILADFDITQSMQILHPIININKLLDSNTSKINIYSDLFLFDDNNELSSISINNLRRLGLVDISYSRELNDNFYLPFEQTSEYLNVERECKIDNSKITIQKGIVTITNLGKAFATICLY